MRPFRLFVFVLPMFVVLLSVFLPLQAQGETILTVATPGWMSDVFNEELFDAFEAEHPGTKVVLVSTGDDSYYSPAAWALEEHLDGAQKYASAADVLMVSSYNVSVEATRAGYFLDLSPLVNTDPGFNVDDFFSPIWESYQWDGGIWAIPASASIQLFVYNIQAFDEAGLPYPNENWTINDLADAARTLTVRDEDGEVDIPGCNCYNLALLFRLALGEGFYDPGMIPNPPKFDQPELPQLIETWMQVQKDITATGDFDYDKVPLSIDTPWRLTNPGAGQEWGASLLPGGTAGFDVQGFAVSAGTQYPELAYALTNYLSSNPMVVNRLFGNTPARRSLVGVEIDDSTFFYPEIPEAVQPLIDEALENGIPTSELRYFDYLSNAMSGNSPDESVDPQTAVQNAEVNALAALETAEQRKGMEVISIPTPVPTPSFGSDQIVLNFGLGIYTGDIPNQAEWDRLIADFLANNPEVGNVDLETQVYQEGAMEKLDCYYQPTSAVQYVELADYVSLDPFIDADPAFDRSDFINGTLSQMEREGRTWGYPIVVQPQVMWYDSERFNEAGVPSPEGGWTIEEFRDALEQLHGTLEDPEDAVFTPETFGNTYLLILIAAYGGVPYDYRTDPPTINFADPATVDTIRQVLDLAKDGYIDYRELVTDGGSIGGGYGSPLFSDSLTGFSWRLLNRQNSENNSEFQDPYRLTNYPRGSEYIPVAYDVGSAYILSHAQNPEACYKWITTIAQRPDLLAGIPARLSQVNDPMLSTTWGEDLANLYQEMADVLQAPNVIVLSRSYEGTESFNAYIEPMWLNKAFDQYVLEDADLETVLAEADQMAKSYRDCASGIPEVDLAELDTQESSLAYYRQFIDCAVGVDPSLKETFSYYYEETD